MPRPPAVESRAALRPVGPFPVSEGTLVGEDAEGRIVPIGRAVRFAGVAGKDHPGSPEGTDARVEVEESGSFAFGFVGWTPTGMDLGRTVWAFSEREVAGAPLGTAFVVGRVVGIVTAKDGRSGVRVAIDPSLSG